MTAKPDAAAAELAARRTALLERYDAQDLHQLRINLRRLRSHLQGRSGKQARLLRHQLGGLADATNAARDWDTLVERAHRELGPRQLQRLEPLLRARQDAAHLPVAAMLRSPRWHEALAGWHKYTERHPPAGRGKKARRAAIKRSEEAVRRAWARAQAVDSERSWHRLRIAIKQLRYRLEAEHKKSRSAQMQATLRQCRRLQDHLGAWHDVAIHRQLIRELALQCRAGREQGILALLRRWCDNVERQGRRHLAAARSELEAPGSANRLGGAGCDA